MSKKILIGGGVVVVSVVLLLLLNNKEESPTLQMDENSNVTTVDNSANGNAFLLVQPQFGVDTVEVDRATLTEGGFLAVRAIDGNLLGQIVEISDYLPAGEYTNISIPLGEFYEGGKELAVMIYEDTGSDKIFNDLDQPYAEDGIPVAVYVATGQPVPESVVINTTAEGIPLMNMGTMENLME